MAALTPVESASALLSAIEKSNLLAAESLTKARETAGALSDPKAVARALIKDGTLTRWQADQLLHGYHRLVVGKYKLLDQLETSPTGRVYLAEHVQMGRRHSLKVLAKRLATNPEAVARFLKGAQNACGLDHKNISHVYDVSPDRLGHYVVMEYVEGQSLEQLVEKSGPLKLPQALDYTAQVADGLAYAHSHGVVHGDLKPANLVRDNNGVIKILEIGQDGAGVRPETDDADEEVETASLAAVIFQAPELRGDGEGADIACDIYSLGSVLSFLLTGKAAKNAAAAGGQLEAIKDIPADIVALCRRLMADSPAERPRSVDEVLSSVLAIANQSGDNTRTAPVDQSTKANKNKRDKMQPGDVAEVVPPGPPPLAIGRSDDLPVIAIDGRISSVSLLAPGEFSIQTRGRLGKRRTGKSKGLDSSPAERWSITTFARRFSPLVLAGAIGGAAVFAFCVAALVVLLVTANRTAKPIAIANDSKAQNPVPAVAAGQIGQGEGNPSPVAADANPELAADPVVAPAGQNPAAAPAPVESIASPTPPSTAAPSAAPASAPSAAVPPAASSPTESKPESSDAPAAVVAAAPAKPAEPSSPPSKKAAGDPFKGFAKAISLPPLPDPDSPVTASLKQVSLGPCDADATTPISIGLLGGDTAIRATRQKFELQPRSENSREWEVQLTGMSEPATIAVLSAKGGELLFQWTEEAAKQSLVARNLMNCALALGKSKQTVALRTTIKGQPLVIDIEKPSAAVKWTIGNLPAPKQIFLEVTRTDGFVKLRQDPKGPTNVGDAVTIGAGPAEKSIPLLLKMGTASGAATVDVRSQVSVKLESWTDARPYRRKDLIALQAQHQQELVKLRGELRKAKDSRPRADAEKEAREATITRLANEETALNTSLDQLRYVLDFAGVTEGAAKVHFRVFCLAGDAKIDLLRTEDDDAAAK